ncbi:hypothetical protein [Photobacterium galatheae]|uniref:Uncharacterized protein n=1 Tax=Photobacterium galatheae TaxID=1654360 RepID=A0A066RU01_9GAMM|nr:hypothetical protein [Photobacterium galatheae]KDM91152.1 hypothetical protein EA58_13460 [Photobacterium galatheae]MCM0150126.1 hypothetical protein [Photobacterium galatheae]
MHGTSPKNMKQKPQHYGIKKINQEDPRLNSNRFNRDCGKFSGHDACDQEKRKDMGSTNRNADPEIGVDSEMK